MNFGQQAPGRFELAIHKRRVEDQLRLGIADLGLALRLDLALHWLEVSLDAVNSNGEGIDQVEALGVLGQDRREHAWDNVSKLRVGVRFNFLEEDFWPASLRTRRALV